MVKRGKVDTCCLVQCLEEVKPISIKLEGTEVLIGLHTHPGLDKYALSQKHAILQANESSEWYIKRVGSSDLYVNEKRIGTELHQLKTGDKIGFGMSYDKYVFYSGPGENTGYFVCEFSKIAHYSDVVTDMVGDDCRNIAIGKLKPNVFQKRNT